MSMHACNFLIWSFQADFGEGVKQQEILGHTWEFQLMYIKEILSEVGTARECIQSKA